MFDRNHNGYLDKHELKPLVESIYDLAGLPEDERHGIYELHDQVKYLLKKLDTNGDKRLSKKEFIDQEKWMNDERLGRFFFNFYDINNQ
jgi:Ca2+-binding EF-hand superfamily protein